MKKKFEKFLKDEGVFEEFCNQLEIDYDETFDEFASYKRNQLSYITRAFAWDSAPSGYKIWSKLHVKWQISQGLKIHEFK